MWYFADDTTIYAYDTSIDAVKIKLEDDIQKLLDLFKNDGMCASPAQFQMMFLGTKSDDSFCLNIGGQWVKQSKQVNLLGIQVDNPLTTDIWRQGVLKNKPKIMCILIYHSLMKKVKLLDVKIDNHWWPY